MKRFYKNHIKRTDGLILKTEVSEDVILSRSSTDF